MDFQNLFYFFGSIYMLLGIILMIVLLGSLFYISKKVKELHAVVREKTEQSAGDIRDVKEELTHQPSLMVKFVGSLIAKGIKNYFTTRSEKSKK